MHPDSEKELLQRVRRVESRLVMMAQALSIDLLAMNRQVKPETRITDELGHHVELLSLDVPVARIRKSILDAWPGHSKPVPVYFAGHMILAVLP